MAAVGTVKSVVSVFCRPRWVETSLEPCAQNTFGTAGCNVDDWHLRICTLISLWPDTQVWMQFLENSCPLRGFLKTKHI